MQPEFDVIVVGAGPAGAAAALTLARKGVGVLMLEKAKVPGERSMTGGVLYGDFEGSFGMINLMPDFERTAPLQRRILSHEVVVLGEPDPAKGTNRYYRFTKNSLAAKIGFLPMGFETGHDFTVLRRPFDRWFANKAVEAGAMLSVGATVEGLVKDGQSVVGVRTSREELRASMVIDASGVTSNLVEEAGLRGRLVPRQLYHGIKRVYKLDAEEIERRFRANPGEGKALFFIGNFMHGVGGGAFIYTNEDSLSVGLVVSMDSLIRATTERFDQVGKLIDIEDEFVGQPMIAELLDGAQPIEYSAHNVPKGFKCLLKRPYADGFMVTGDALGSFVKIGPMIDGMRRAIASGMMAATAYMEARASGSFRGRNLSRYRDLLQPIYEDVDRSGRDSFISESSFVYHQLPGLVLGTPMLARNYRSKQALGGPARGSAVQRVQDGTSLLKYEEDEDYSHIAVDTELASNSITKPWVPVCPVNCYTIVTPKGVFASFKDLFEHNLQLLSESKEGPSGLRSRAFRLSGEEIASAKLRFDHVACVSCGSCGAIGPPEMVLFRHERDGHGVRYAQG
ncbi:MAG: FAD-dependent oxidoreductase [Nitrososphaerota archaeon]|nr:FAD-dependent oxidoreductase [Nitrososphaerota archaeon]